MAKYFVTITEDMYGATASCRIGCPVASELVLKKMWKHYYKMYRYMDSFDVSAYMEDETGLHDLSMFWCLQEQEHMVMAGAIPFCC